MIMDGGDGLNLRTFYILLLVPAAVAGLPAAISYGQESGCALVLQPSPVEGGTITPGVGVHYFKLNSTVTLTAVAKPGYQFVCWLGDVSDPTSNSTVVNIDGPKLIIAVFELAEFELVVTAAELVRQGAPIGGVTTSARDYSRRGFGGPGRRPPPSPRVYIPPKPPEIPDFPVPEEGDEFPVPVPEPSTMIFILAGAIFLTTRCKKVLKRW